MLINFKLLEKQNVKRKRTNENRKTLLLEPEKKWSKSSYQENRNHIRFIRLRGPAFALPPTAQLSSSLQCHAGPSEIHRVQVLLRCSAALLLEWSRHGIPTSLIYFTWRVTVKRDSWPQIARSDEIFVTCKNGLFFNPSLFLAVVD